MTYGDPETPCPNREDSRHCIHWFDDEPCCACGDDGTNPPDNYISDDPRCDDLTAEEQVPVWRRPKPNPFDNKKKPAIVDPPPKKPNPFAKK